MLQRFARVRDCDESDDLHCRSSDEEDYSRNPTSSTGGNRAWKDFVQEEEANRGSLLDDDPFGDAAQVDADTPGAYDRPRAHVW